MRLSIRNFAQIESADIDFGNAGDLTLLVGQQATGKSLILQWLKLVSDPLTIRTDWERFGSNWRTDQLRPLDLFFGEGLGIGYRAGLTSIKLDGQEIRLKTLFNRPSGRKITQDTGPVETAYFIPAHRALLLTDGWPRNFQQHVPGTPYVARAQSERLARWLSDAGTSIFPIANKLPKELRDLFDQAIFHSATLNVDRSSPQSRLILKANQNGAPIPYMAWTAGQREFVPLLIALYELMPSGGNARLQKQGEASIQTVVLEEPELGLHPKALFAVGVGILHLLARGYRVVVSSHSPLMVDFAWALNRLRIAKSHGKASISDFLRAFDLKSTRSNKDLAGTLGSTHARTYYLSYSQVKRIEGMAPLVHGKDISSLQTYSSDPDKSSWGELLKYSSSLAEVIGQLDFDFSSLTEKELAS
ncbi:MAG: AAA family ATPase [Curvibacter sp.]|jgi:hypothetical protein|nr:AAA family ATPase [Curvibacter sp.]